MAYKPRKWIFESSVPVAGANETRSMSAKIKYTDEPLGKVQAIADFLPSPAELAFREQGVKVTLSLSKKSIEFVNAKAAKHRTQYQRMIRRLVDAFFDGQAQRSTRTLRDSAANPR